jgi:RNA polymerase sigma-70 factor (ECF subfamily)
MSHGSNTPADGGIQSGEVTSRPGESDGMTAALVLETIPTQTDVARAARGDSAAFERLYRAHLPRVTSLARWLLGTEDVDDAVQDVFVRVWEKLDTFQGDAAFGTWLHRVAVNLLLRRRQRRAVQWSRQVASEPAMDAVVSPVGRPELRIALEGAVSTLPAGAREVFVLHDMEGYKHEEIATQLGIDPGTSRSQLHRARALLRKQLQA